MRLRVTIAAVTFALVGCVHRAVVGVQNGSTATEMCTYAGLENIPASSPQCLPPAPPPPPPAPQMCPYPGLGGITANDPACVPQVQAAPPPEPALDSLPWPPPKPSVKEVLPSGLCQDPRNPTLQGSWNLVHAAFQRAGFPNDERTFAIGIDEGFAMLGRMEAINDDGTPRPKSQRWGSPMGDPGSFSMSQWFRRVFSRVTGRYRVIAIIVTPRLLKTSSRSPLFAGLDSLVDAGPIGPPPAAMAARQMSPSINCYALIYELERPALPAKTGPVYPSHITALEHLAKARMWSTTSLGLR